MNLIGRFQFLGLVRSLLVVDLHGLPNHPTDLGQIGRPMQQELHLRNPSNALGQRVLVAVMAVLIEHAMPWRRWIS